MKKTTQNKRINEYLEKLTGKLDLSHQLKKENDCLERCWKESPMAKDNV